MKRTLTTLTAMVMCCVVALASTPTKLGKTTEINIFQKDEPSKFTLAYTSTSEGPVTIKFFDEKGRLVKTDRVTKKKKFVKTYNLINLEAGLYTVKIQNNEGEVMETINYDPFQEDFDVVVNESKEDHFNVQVSGFDFSESVTLTIYDDQGRLLKTDVVNSNKGFTRIYDLSKIDSDYYTFSVTNGSDNVFRLLEDN